MHESDVIESLGIKKPVLIPGLGKLFWRLSYRSSQYSDEVDFLDASYVPNWITHYYVPRANNILENEFQFFYLNLILDRPLREGDYSIVGMHIDHLLGTTDVGYMTYGDEDATLDQLSLPKNLVLALKSILVNLHGGEMSCRYYNIDDADDPLLVEIDFVRCETSEIPPDDLLLTIASVINSWMS